jgi:hypothetical protein
MSVVTVPPGPRLPPGIRPTTWDLFLVMAGCAFSYYLLAISHSPTENTSVPPLPLVRHFGHMRIEPGGAARLPIVKSLVLSLPDLMRLHEGILLLFPLLYLTQTLMARPLGFTTCEWMWIFAWMGTVLITGMGAWQQFGDLTGLPYKVCNWAVVIWYMVFVPAIALITVGCWLYSAVQRKPYPWTHNFAVVLLAWPVPWLIALMVLGKFPP